MLLAVEDYASMCEALGPLDFESFCQGYAEYEAWFDGRDTGSLEVSGVQCRAQGDFGDRDSYAA